MTSPLRTSLFLPPLLLVASLFVPTATIAQGYLPPSQNNSSGREGRVYTEPGEYDYRKAPPRKPDYNRPARRYQEQRGYNIPRNNNNSAGNQDYYGIPDRNSRNPQRGSSKPYSAQNDDYRPPPRDYNNNNGYKDQYRDAARPPYKESEGHLKNPEFQDVYSEGEITNAGHRFFGKITVGLAKILARAFKKNGRPTGYILGEDAGGAFIGGLRYGEGTLFTKKFGEHKIFWQGPSVGYDFGASGAKTMTLVYNLKNINFIFQRFGGVSGSAYVVGGVGITLQKRDDVTLAPIRSGIGLRLGANIGYLKYTRRPTWNPF